MKTPHLLSTLSLLTISSFGIVPTAHAASTMASGIVDFSPNPPSEPAFPADPAPNSQPNVSSEPATSSDSSTQLPGAVSFDVPPAAPRPPAPAAPPPPPPQRPPTTATASPSDPDIFTGGSNSLVARTVGHAEGTRTPDGSKTRAYNGHTDPGNGVWNLGSFSFQHCRSAQYNCSTAEEADVHQLRRLQGQADQLLAKAESLGITMSLEEELNGIDLANQAPLAALGQPGYTDWLKKAREKGLTDEEAILWARVSSYWDPAINGWNAPGLGNSEANITHDQNRRMTAIARALDVYNQQVAAGKIEPSRQAKVERKPREEQIADRIISQDLARNN